MAEARATRKTLVTLLRAESKGDAIFMLITGGFAVALVAIFVTLLVILGQGAAPAFARFGFGFLWSTNWNPPDQLFGAAPYIVGTLLSASIALIVAVPVAIGTAVALAILLPRYIATPLGTVIELLAAVPSIVLGVWGFFLITPFVRNLSNGQTFGPSVLAAGLVLAVMVLPIITAVSRDMIRVVPQSQRDAALALGATQWEVTWQVVLPYARPGMLAAVILGFGRAIGETMAVIMVIGNKAIIPKSLYDPASTMASVIANEFGDSSNAIHYSSLVALGLLLLLLSLLMSLGARFIVKRLGKRLGVDR